MWDLWLGSRLIDFDSVDKILWQEETLAAWLTTAQPPPTGAQGDRDDLSSFFFRQWRSTMEDWRRAMHYPPKLSEVWRSLKELNLCVCNSDYPMQRDWVWAY